MNNKERNVEKTFVKEIPVESHKHNDQISDCQNCFERPAPFADLVCFCEFCVLIVKDQGNWKQT